MSSFNEANTVEGFIRDRLCGGVTHHTAVGPGLARRQGRVSGHGWHFLAPQNLARQPHEVLVEDHLRDALIRLNPEIAAQPDRVDDVLYRLRAILLGVRSDGLVKANEEFTAWLIGERSMPFGDRGEHVTIRLIDFDDLERNQYVVTTQFTCRAGASEKRADLVLLVNGVPLIVIEAKTPVRASQSWFDAAVQIHEDYERNVPELFVPTLVGERGCASALGHEPFRSSLKAGVRTFIRSVPYRRQCGDESALHVAALRQVGTRYAFSEGGEGHVLGATRCCGDLRQECQNGTRKAGERCGVLNGFQDVADVFPVLGGLQRVIGKEPKASELTWEEVFELRKLCKRGEQVFVACGPEPLVAVSSLHLQTGERAIGMFQKNVFMLFTKQLYGVFGAVEK